MLMRENRPNSLFGQMSFDQTGVQAYLTPWVTRPLPAKKSTKVGREVFMSSFEQVSGVVSILEAGKDFVGLECYRARTDPVHEVEMAGAVVGVVDGGLLRANVV
jgi:hypothetical protein